jgi:hypothetical protein
MDLLGLAITAVTGLLCVAFTYFYQRYRERRHNQMNDFHCFDPECPDFGDPDFGEGTCPAEHANRYRYPQVET